MVQWLSDDTACTHRVPLPVCVAITRYVEHWLSCSKMSRCLVYCSRDGELSREGDLWWHHNVWVLLQVYIVCVVNMNACRGTKGSWQVTILHNFRYEAHVHVCIMCTQCHVPYPEHFPHLNTFPWPTAQGRSDNQCSTVCVLHSVFIRHCM